MYETAKLYYKFWSSFGIPAFARDSVPDGQTFPYITYDIPLPETLLNAQQQVFVWTKTTDNSEVMKICEKIKDKISPANGVILESPDNQAIIVRRGNPFMQDYPQEENNIKAAYINVVVESCMY